MTVISTFWKHGEKGAIEIVHQKLYDFLSNQGFGYMKVGVEKTPIPVRVENHVVTKLKMEDMKKYVIDTINEYGELNSLEEEDKKVILSRLAKTPSLFDAKNLYFFREIKPDFVKDTADKSYFYFEHAYCVVTKDEMKFYGYDKLNGYVFKEQIIPHAIDETALLSTEGKNEFWKFVENVTYHKVKARAETKLKCLTSYIGYLLHRYKDPSLGVAVIFMDEDYSDKPMGGTGKGILIKALSYVRPTVVEDGKTIKLSSQFPFARVSYGINIFCLDDVDQGLNFEKLFPLVTEGMVIERKYVNRYKIPYEDSPKIVISTNYGIEGEGDSFERRMVEFGFSRYFNLDHNPEQEFGHLLFIDWSESDWIDFYLCMMDCVQKYLKDGLINDPMFNSKIINLTREAGQNFLDLVTEILEPDKRYNKEEFYQNVLSKIPELKVREQYTIIRWVNLFCKAMGLIFHQSHSGDENYFIISDPAKK